MSAYDNIDRSLPGELQGIDHDIKGGFSAQDSAGIDFGKPAFGYVGDAISLHTFKNDVAKIVFDADFVTDNDINMNVNGVAMAEVPFNTDHDTTGVDLVNALNAMTGVEAVLDLVDATNRTFYIRTKGATALIADLAVTNGATQATGTVTYTTGQVFLGITMNSANAPGLYEFQDAVNVVAKRQLSASCGTACNANSKAYVGTNGLLANSGIAIPVVFRETLAAAGVPVVEVTGELELGVAALFI